MRTTLKYKILSLIVIVAGCFSVRAQDVTNEIKTGDKCPDITINNIINYKTATAKISNFKGKMVILDFWATWCNPCVRAFPKMDSIQKQFSSKVQIISVSNEDEKTVRVFLEKMKSVKNISPVTVYGDEILNDLFKHTYLPHFVWIDETGVVCAITTEEEVTAENIDKLLNKKAASIKEKTDVVKHVDERRPFFFVGNIVQENGGTNLDTLQGNNLIYHSALTGFVKGVPGYATVSDSNRITAVNQSIAYLYSIAAGHFQWELLMPNRQRVELQDSVLYYKCTGQSMSTKEYVANEKYDAWAKENAMCYELSVPDVLREKRFEIMLNDLNNCFGSLYGIEGRIEKRKVKALVLKRTTTEDKIKTKGVNKPYMQNAYFYGLYNEPFSYFIGDMRQYYQLSYALIDETDYKGNTDLELNCKLSDIDELNKELSRYGLKFFEEEREVEMVVIKNKAE